MADRAPGTADWPDVPATDRSNVQTVTQPVEVTPPEDTGDPDTDTAEERYLKQQWIDVAASDVPAAHPLSINRDSQYVTDDPYTT